MEQLRESIIQSSAIVIQVRWKGYLARRKYQDLRRYVIICQRRFRQLASRRQFLRVRHIIIRMQANVRAKQTRKWYLIQVNFIIKLQALARFYLAKKTFRMMLRRRGICDADMAVENDMNTQLFFCKTDISEDPLLRNSCLANSQRSSEAINEIKEVVMASTAPEIYTNSQSCEATPIVANANVRLPISDSYADMFNFVDDLFQDVFSSVGVNNIKDDAGKVTLENGCYASLINPSQSAVKEPEVVKASNPLSKPIFEYGANKCGNGFKTSSSFLKIPLSTASQTPTSTSRSPSTEATFSEMEVLDDDRVGWGEYSFSKFAAAYFEAGATPIYSPSLIGRPLLKHKNQEDIDLALKIFGRILSFMEPKSVVHCAKTDDSNSVINGEDDLSSSNTTAYFDSALKCPRVVVPGFGMNGQDIPLSQYHEEDFEHCSKQNYTPTVRICQECKPDLSGLKRVRFIIRSGIESPQLRDEIYCQILKQLTKNPNVFSRSRGWILLILCASCFPPSAFDGALKNYLKSNPSEYAKTCLYRLKRVIQSGARTMPPSYMEFRAEQEKKSLGVNVLCTDGTRVRVKVDPTITFKEFTKMTFNAASIKDTFGFEIFIKMFNKVEALSSDPKHFFDKISQCEEVMRSKGLKESELPWSLSIKKTIFAPWHDVAFDPVATNLICYQVIQQCFRESHEPLAVHELAYLLANIYRLISIDTKDTDCNLNSWLVDILSSDGDIAFWKKAASTALEELEDKSPNASAATICENIVTFAKLQWHSIFTREFNASFLPEEKAAVQKIQICVDCKGVQLFDDKRKLIRSIPYIEINSVTIKSEKLVKVLSMKTVWMEELLFTSSRSEELRDLLNYMINGLRQRSRYAIALKKSSKNDYHSGSSIQVNPGDFIKLHQMGWELDAKKLVVGYPEPTKSTHNKLTKCDLTNFCYGENQRTRETGRIVMDDIYIFPTISPPKPEFIDAYAHQIISNESKEWFNKLERVNSSRIFIPMSKISANNFNSTKIDNFLQKYNQRPMSRNSGIDSPTRSSVSSPRSVHSLKHTKQPIRQPFLKELASSEQKAKDAALLSFRLIQTYMGDCDKIPLQLKNMPAVFLTDLLFGAALDFPPLRDEIFIQLMNQLTDNPKESSVDHGMELLWLATGIMIPSEKTKKKLVKFLNLSNHPLAIPCYTRLHHTISRGIRKKPPHALELSLIKGRKEKIIQSVLLPNNETLKITLESTTKAGDIIKDISLDLGLMSLEQFALYLEVDGELRCIQTEEFIFDALRQTLPDIEFQVGQKRSVRSSNNGCVKYPTAPPPSPLYLLRKLWVNVIPEKCLIEDSLFNFPQTMKNFLQGYYKCSLEQALELSTLIFIWQTDETRCSQTSLDQIIPKNMLSRVTDAQWISKMTSVIATNHRLSRKDIPKKFLNAINKITSLGSSFYHVETDGTSSKRLLIVDPNAIALVDELNGTKQWYHKIENIAECWQENQKICIHMRRANSIIKLVATETTAYNVCDLINSYIRYHKLISLK
ncbi:unnamed protein product [Rodentolepis nana]|uniref:MyTH4 domain-containing protein n=1 Tax=Rodentolepis nana TaxID=102285 RepID=A0A3P7RIS0_RODNA|nr:unnamed protein product [Rodentolepis nana]